MIDEYTKLPYIGKKRAKKLQSSGVGLEDIAKMDETELKKYVSRVSHSKLKIIIATARDIVGRMYDIESSLKLDRHKAKILALNGYDVKKISQAKKKDIMKLIDVDEQTAFKLIFNAALHSGVKKTEIKIKKEEIDRKGILSKEGFVNGFGSGWGDLKAESRVHFHLLPFIIVALLITSGVSISLLFMNPGLRIDGNLSDWNSVSGYQYGNFTYKYRLIGNSLYFLVEKNDIFSVDESFYIAVDDGHGGYWMDGIQARYVAEFYGWNGTLKGAHLWKYSSGSRLWNFTAGAGMDYAAGPDGVEGEIPGVSASSRVVFVEKVNNNVVLRTPPLSVSKNTVQVVESTLTDVIQNDTEVFRINVTAPAQFELSRVVFNIDGANLSSGTLTVNTDTYSGTAGSAPVFNVGRTVKNAIIILQGNFTGTPQSAVKISARLYSKNAVFSYVNETARMYLYSAPEHVKIDGAFGDWAHQKIVPDVIGDVHDSNIDLVNYSHTSGFTDVYMQVRGEFMGGTDIPIVRKWHFKDSDHDGVPDCVDPYPHDFNNDGIPDNESYVIVDGKKLPDVDGDGIPDYPYGPDMWLNTTIPSNFPKPYAGRHVSVYIGPPPPVKPESGNDTAEIYFGDNSGGARLYWVPFPVRYKITITGRDGQFVASEYEYERGNWQFMGTVKHIAAGYHRVELATGLNISAGRMWITVFNWNHEHDMPSVVRATRSVSTENVFYLHADASGNPGGMDWNVGTNKQTKELETSYSGGSVSATWKYNAPLASDYTVLGARVDFYVSAASITSGSRAYDKLFINLTATDGTNTDLVANTSFLVTSSTYSSSGNYSYALEIQPGNLTIPKGYYLELVLTFATNWWSGGDYIDFDYNSTAPYDSNLTITTNTTMQVHSVWTGNGTANTSKFEKGDTVYLYANVTDPLGTAHIAGATVSVNDPMGNVVLNGSSMSVLSSGTGYEIFEFSTALTGVNTATGVYAYTGKYPVSVTATDAEGFSDTNNSWYFYVPSDIRFVYSKSLYEPAGEHTVWFANKIINDGGGDEIMNFVFNSSAQPKFNTEIYLDANGDKALDSGDVLYAIYNATTQQWTYIKNDTDANGAPDVTVMYGETVHLIVQENLSLSSSNSYVYFNLFANSSTGNIPQSPAPSGNVWDVAILRGINIKTLYLKGGGTVNTAVSDYLDPTTPDGTTDVYYTTNVGGPNQPPDGTFWWNTTDWVRNTMVLAGNITIKVNITANGILPPDGYYNMSLSIEKRGVIIPVGYSNLSGNELQPNAWYSFSISPQIPQIPRGWDILLNWSTNVNANLHFNSTYSRSEIIFNTTSYLYTMWTKLYNDTGRRTNSFRAGHTVEILTALRDPFGAPDIKSVFLNVTNPNGTQIASYKFMSLKYSNWTDLWDVYAYNYSIPVNAAVGNYTITITGVESDAVENATITPFRIVWDISITPHTNSSTGITVYYNHTVWNNGTGTDLINFEVWSNQTANITLYAYVNGQLELMAYSNTGTGWSWVNSSFDTDGDGNPDTGYMASGTNERIIMRVRVINAVSAEEVNTTLNITDLVSIGDSASDITTVPVPEFSGALFVILLAPMLLIVYRKRHK